MAVVFLGIWNPQLILPVLTQQASHIKRRCLGKLLPLMPFVCISFIWKQESYWLCLLCTCKEKQAMLSRIKKAVVGRVPSPDCKFSFDRAHHTVQVWKFLHSLPLLYKARGHWQIGFVKVTVKSSLWAHLRNNCTRNSHPEFLLRAILLDYFSNQKRLCDSGLCWEGGGGK